MVCRPLEFWCDGEMRGRERTRRHHLDLVGGGARREQQDGDGGANNSSRVGPHALTRSEHV